MRADNTTQQATLDQLRDLLARGWSYRQLARELGLSCGGVHHIMSGRIKRPRPIYCERIAALHATGLTGPYNPNRRMPRETA